MNTDQIKALKERADKATDLLATHESVSRCAQFDRLPSDLLPEALRLAKAGILARIEAEIAELLATCVPRKVGEIPAMPIDLDDDDQQPVTLSRWATMEQT